MRSPIANGSHERAHCVANTIAREAATPAGPLCRIGSYVRVTRVGVCTTLVRCVPFGQREHQAGVSASCEAVAWGWFRDNRLPKRGGGPPPEDGEAERFEVCLLPEATVAKD